MKRTSVVLMLCLLLLAFAGCGQGDGGSSPAAEPEGSPGTPPVESTEQGDNGFAAAAMADEDGLLSLVTGLEVVMSEDFLFTDAGQLDSQALLHFFHYTLSTLDQASYDQYESQWKGGDGQYHVPVATINEQLGRYLQGFKFDPATIEGYDATEDAIVETMLGGFGGDCWPRFSDMTRDGETLTLKTDFYDEGYTAVQYSKTFVLKYYGENQYYLLSISQ